MRAKNRFRDVEIAEKVDPKSELENIRISNALKGKKSAYVEEADKAKMCFPSRRGAHFDRNRGFEVAMRRNAEN